MLRVGDRVEMTVKATKGGHNSGNKKYLPTTGGVVTRDQIGNHAFVLRDCRKEASSYHVCFWQLEPTSYFYLNR